MESAMRITLSAAVMAMGLAVAVAAPAKAALIGTGHDCAARGALTAFAPDAVACAGAFAGNDRNQLDDTLLSMTAVFGGTTGPGVWTYRETVDKRTEGAILDRVVEDASGSIEFKLPMTGLFSLVLKAGNQFSLYLFDASASSIDEVFFTTSGVSVNKKGKPQDLSHVSLYTFEAADNGTNPAAVPLPAPGVLLGFGLIGAGIVARLRRKR
jgi:hypothetical protein